MRRLLSAVLVSAFIAPTAAAAATYVIDTPHSTVEFSIKYLVGKVKGRFTEFSGTIEYDEARPEESSVSATAQASSIDTGNDRRDSHLRSPDFFDVGEYPEITFTSSRVRETDDGLEVEGTFTMHGVKKNIVIPVEILGSGANPRGAPTVWFSAEFTINRTDYGIDWNKALDIGKVLLGDEVTISLLVQAAEPNQE